MRNTEANELIHATEKPQKAPDVGGEALPNENIHGRISLSFDGLPATATDPGKSFDLGAIAKANITLLAWLIFLTLGGGILSFYYAHIGYLPDISWSDSIVYLAVASLIGGTVGLLLALSLLLPGCIWSEFLIFDKELRNFFCFDGNTNEPCVHSLWWGVGLPFGVVLLLAHLALQLVRWPWIIYLPISILLLLAAWWIMGKRFKEMLIEGQLRKLDPTSDASSDNKKKLLKEPADKQRKRRIFKYNFWFLLSIALSQISMLLVFLLAG